MVGWPRRGAREARPAAEDPGGIAPWQGAGMTAERVPVEVGRRGRTVPGVLLRAGELRVRLRADELGRFADGTLDIVESVAEPPVFLARAGAAAPDSVAGERTRGLPEDAVVLLPAETTGPPAVVLGGDVLAGFLRWAGHPAG